VRRSPDSANNKTSATLDEFTSDLIVRHGMCISEDVVCFKPIGCFQHAAGFLYDSAIKFLCVHQSILFVIPGNRLNPPRDPQLLTYPKIFNTKSSETSLEYPTRPSSRMSAAICPAVSISVMTETSLTSVNFYQD
jgi:hypothetical protein